jgi:hypothetical protein
MEGVATLTKEINIHSKKISLVSLFLLDLPLRLDINLTVRSKSYVPPFS